MAKPQRWTDDWVRGLEHPAPGEPERVYYDPTLSGHRAVIKRTRKMFEIQAKRPKRFGPSKTWVVQVGDALDCTVEEARSRAVAVLAGIRDGQDPHAKPQATVTTVGSAWAEFKERSDLGTSTLEMYKKAYGSGLAHWANVPLQTLVNTPRMARDEHAAQTKARGPSAADHGFRLLRTLHRYAAKLDVTLSGDRHPCSAVAWHGDQTRKDAAIPATQMPAWHAQVEALRAKSPGRAAFQMLLLRLGCRPGELASAKWVQVDFEKKLFWIPVSKTESYEQPLSKQAIAELRALEAMRVHGEDHIFPARGKAGHLTRIQEKEALSHSSNEMRHTHHTIGTVLEVNELVLDVLEGRSLLKSGAAGRGYVDKGELGPKVRAAQAAINDQIDTLLAGKAR
jgi:integrase